MHVSVWYISAGLLWFPVTYMVFARLGLNVERINITLNLNFPNSEIPTAYSNSH